jgi:hypothetical protein
MQKNHEKKNEYEKLFIKNKKDQVDYLIKINKYNNVIKMV